MTFLIALGALALAGFTFYINNQQHKDFRHEIDELRHDLNKHKAALNLKANLNFGKK